MKKLISWNKPIPKYGTSEWKAYQYVQALIAKRGPKIIYDDGTKLDAYLEKGYEIIEKTSSIGYATNTLIPKYREKNYYCVAIGFKTSVFGCPEILILIKLKK